MGGTERPEHADRPSSDADRIARYEERVNEYYSQPENRDKLDPFSRMSLDEIKRLYRTDDDDPNRPRAVVEGGVARLIDPANEQQRDEPRWHTEPETVRRIRADHEDRTAGDREPTGQELLDMDNDEKSRPEKAREKLYDFADDFLDSAEEIADTAYDVLAPSPPPSHSETRTGPHPYAFEPARHEAADAGSVTTGVLVALAMAVEATRLGLRNCREHTEGT